MLKFAFEKKKKYFFKTCSLIWLVGGKVLLFVYILITGLIKMNLRLLAKYWHEICLTVRSRAAF